MKTIKAITGYSTADAGIMLAPVEIVASIPTGGHDGHGEPDTEQLTVVRTEWNDLALCRTSNAYLGNAFGMPITYVQGANNNPKLLASMLRALAHQLDLI